VGQGFRDITEVSPSLGGRTSGTPSLHHIAVGTGDVEGLARFYRQLLATDERRRHWDERGELRSIWLDLSGTLLMIERVSADAEPRGPVTGVGLGAFLLAFRAPAGERVEFEARAAALGAVVESRSAYTSYLRDPDGNRIAISDYEVSA
jgi:catechol 2,3-dioxygenase-like lactoylglutathione lyase family enzyme